MDPAVPMQLVPSIKLLATDRTSVLVGERKMHGLQMILHVMLHGEELAADAAFKLLGEAVQDLDVILQSYCRACNISLSIKVKIMYIKINNKVLHLYKRYEHINRRMFQLTFFQIYTTNTTKTKRYY